MFSVTLRPRAYRLKSIITMNGGFPFEKILLQCQTRLGWGTIYTFHDWIIAKRALEEWRNTLK